MSDHNVTSTTMSRIGNSDSTSSDGRSDVSHSSDQEIEGSPTPPPEEVTVSEAIEDAPGPELRKLVKRL
ncbi:hypothetical protein WHR41_09447 [Cladosporium halotolerans]|uniref:Uncharacterized protein n=1 Tax=Cladosporium halotolerans TaxID=1052096 RepID=A0AB34KCG0_9PEZI